MFSIQHFIWIAICVILITVSCILICKYKIKFTTFFNIVCVLAVISEFVKVLSMMEIVELADGTYAPYLELNHLPFHLCSIQIIFIFIVRFTNKPKLRNVILGFMYPTCIVGAIFAIMLPSIYSATITPSDSFTHPIIYQTFLFHAMLIVTGFYIIKSDEIKLKNKYYLTTILILFGLAFMSFYINSLFASVVYTGEEEFNVGHVTNFFFTYKPVLNSIILDEKWKWYLYVLVLIALAIVLIAIMYIPVFIKNKKQQLQENENLSKRNNE